MNLYNTTNIKALPPVEQILPGNFLVVEDTVGTKKLNFNDFVIGPNNTSFYNSLDTRIKTLSTQVTSLSTAVLELSAAFLQLTTPNVGAFTLSSPFSSKELTVTSISPLLSTYNVSVMSDTYNKGLNWKLTYKQQDNTLYSYMLDVSTAQIADSTDVFYYKISLI